MWDFLIVLGQVPGTNFQITINEIYGFVLVSILLITIYKSSKPVRKIVTAYYKKLKRVLKAGYQRPKEAIETRQPFPHLNVHSTRQLLGRGQSRLPVQLQLFK